MPDTLDSLDIGHILWRHAYRNQFIVGGAAVGVCASGERAHAFFRRSVSCVSNQPPNRLHLLASLSGRGSGRFGAACACAPPPWPGAAGTLAPAVAAVAFPISALGSQKTAPRLAWPRRASHRHAGTLVAPARTGDTPPSAPAPWTATVTAATDGSASRQSCLDG